MFRVLTTSLALLVSACAVAGESGRKLSPEQAEAMITEKVQLLDVRTEEEWNEGRLADATRIEIGTRDFTERVKTSFDLSKPILIYCRSGVRSARAADRLEAHGFQAVYDLKGGILAWKKEGKTVVK